MLHTGAQLIVHSLEAVEQQRVERAALAVEDHLQGSLVGEGLLVAAIARERVVNIRERDDLCRNGDLVALEPVGIAAAVPALMMPAADLVRGAHERVVLRERHIVEQPVALDRMGLHDLELLARELAGLVEDLGGGVDLADVVQGGNGADHRDIRLRERISVRHLDKLVQQQVRDGAHVQDVRAGFKVFRLDHVTENIDHGGVRLLALVDLLLGKVDKVLLTRVERERVVHAAAHDRKVEGPADVIGHAEVIGLLNKVRVILGRDDDNRDLLCPVALTHDLEHAEAVKVRHIDIEQQKVDIEMLMQQVKRLHAVVGVQVVVARSENFGEQLLIHFGVIGDENSGFIHSDVLGCAFGGGTRRLS